MIIEVETGGNKVTTTMSHIGKGVYSVAEASRLTGIPAAQIRRWTRGYRIRTKAGVREQPPIFDTEFETVDQSHALSFLDLIEIQFIHSFRKHGVSWNAIRVATQRAASILQFSHPFTKREFFTDGSSILTRIGRESDEPELLNLVIDQYEMNSLVSPLLYENIDFGELDIAERWWPNGRSAGVVVDPSMNLGKPIVAKYNIPTSVLAQAYRSVGSVELVANWYEIDQAAVECAIKFEMPRAA